MTRRFAYLFATLLLLIGCVDPYQPPAITAPNRYLVVDGLLTTDTSRIQLSRTQNLGESTKPSPELGATVRVEETGGAAYTLADKGQGLYALESARLVVGRTYRLTIRTKAGGTYQSAPITMKATPAIDSLTWAVENSGLQIFVNTHDPANRTRYYRWTYEDTYEFYTPYLSTLDFVNGRVVQREPVNHCWRTAPSTAIVIGSTARLSQDVLQRAPLLFIPGSSPKLNVKYSLLVQQYALSAEAYAYWLNLQKTTEQLGSLFDPLPAQVVGNLTCLTNPDEPVLGFVDASTVVQRRVFIDRPAALPRNLIRTGYEGCFVDTIPKPRQPLSAFVGLGGGYALIQNLERDGLYLGVATPCADCRDRGTVVKPSYWP